MASLGLQELPAPHAELVDYIAQNADTPMAEIMEPYRTYEAQLRKVFAQDRQNPALNDPYINVLPLFTESTKNITARARNLDAESKGEKECYIMSLPDDKRRPHGSPSVVGSIKEFQKNFNIFSESSMADMNWDNVVAAGSSVVNCLLPVPPEFNTTKRKLREYYHEKFCPASDVDLFLYGLTHDEAIAKIKQIEQAVRDAILSEVTIVRTKYAITIASQYPTRHIQVVLRVYKSISEILTGFDIDAAGGAYNGKQVYVTPRALGSFITQINHVDLSRRSPSYENRLSKYSHRNFEVHWPELDRSRIDPTIYERSFQRTLGLARLLVLERLPTSSVRDDYMNKRRAERGRPTVYRYRHNFFGNIKDNHEDEVADWVDETEVSNYHTFTIPYGEKFHAKKIEKLCYTRDLLLNAEWNQPKQREVFLHRHPAFFGRVQDVIEDCCGCCPKPVTPEEMEVAKKEAEIYISGKVSFLIDDPGRQQIGSFNPLTEEDWTDMAYVGNTARLCQSIVDGDVEDVLSWLSQPEADPNKRDYTGRTPLHLAVMSSTPEVVRCLIDHGARLTARLADGRTALHLAAERGIPDMVRSLMEKSVANEEIEEEKQDRRRKALQSSQQDSLEKNHRQETKQAKAAAESSEEESEESSEESSDVDIVDDGDSDEGAHSFATGSFVKIQTAEEVGKDDIVPEESADEPDYYKIDLLAWDVPCSPLHLAIAEGHEEVVKTLCEYGADAILPVKFLNSDKEPTAAILTLALAIKLPLEKAKSMASLLLRLGATSAQADLKGCTAFHRYVENGSPDLIDVLWENDKTGVKAALNHLVMSSSYWNPSATGPLHTAINNSDAILVMKLLNAGADPEISFETWLKAAKTNESMEKRLTNYERNKTAYLKSVEQPLITAIRNCDDAEAAIHLLEHGADPNSMTTSSQVMLADEWQRRYYTGETALDLVRAEIRGLRKYKGEPLTPAKPELAPGADEFLQKFMDGTYQHWMVSEDIKCNKEQYNSQLKSHEKAKKELRENKAIPEKMEAIQEAISNYEMIEKAIVANGGKTFAELHPEIKGKETEKTATSSKDEKKREAYEFNFTFYQVSDVTEARKAAYIELFEGAWSGDLEKVKGLTLQSWDEEQSEPPLAITVVDSGGNSPFSLAFLRGHYDVAKGIAEIAEAQYAPADEEKRLYRIKQREQHDESDEDSDAHSDDEDSDGPKIVSQIVDKKFTMENIGQVSMQVKSRTTALQMILSDCATFKVENGEPTERTRHLGLLWFVLIKDQEAAFKQLLDLCIRFAAKKADKDGEDGSGSFTYPEHLFQLAIENGKIQALAEVIKRTGAGIPLDHLVKKTGVEMQEKPRYYQGLTVYGKKRKDWATAGRNLFVKATGLKTPPLLHAALGGNLESVEWFLGDAPHRLYLEFSNSKAAREDSRLKHLSQTPGGFESAISKWLGNQNDLVLHCAIMAETGEEATRVFKYIMQVCPSALEAKTSAADTPFLTACRFGRTEYVKMLVKAGVDQTARNANGQNAAHLALGGMPPKYKLKPLLEALDPEVRNYLLLQRDSLYYQGCTPLHDWISSASGGAPNPGRLPWYKTNEDIVAVFDLIVGYTKGAELGMLNGAGNTCLHDAITRESVLMTKVLLKYKPKLLYRENAVGRTPAEIARDRVTGAKFQQPESVNQTRYRTALVSKDPSEFVGRKDKKAASSASGQTATTKEQVWEICREYMEKYPDKRKLVSLNEANDVAKRIGEEHNASRYFSVQARDDEEQEEQGKEADLEDFACKQMGVLGVKVRAWRNVDDWKTGEEYECPDCGMKHTA